MEVKSFEDRMKKVINHPKCPKLVIYAAGGGGHFMQWLMSTPGASNLLLEAQFPYSRAATRSILRTVTKKENFEGATDADNTSFASDIVAQQLCESAFRRCKELALEDYLIPSNIPVVADRVGVISDMHFAPSPPYTGLRRKSAADNQNVEHPFERLIGIGLSAALTTDRQRMGSNKVYYASSNGKRGCSVLPNGFNRKEQERDVSETLLMLLEEEVNAEERPESLLGNGSLERDVVSSIEKLSAGELSYIILWDVGRYGVCHENPSFEAISRSLCYRPCKTIIKPDIGTFTPKHYIMILPGAFNPIHQGHCKLMRAAEAFVRYRELQRRNEFQFAHSVSHSTANHIQQPCSFDSSTIICLYELSCVNSDKGNINVRHLEHRISLFPGAYASNGLQHNELLQTTELGFDDNSASFIANSGISDTYGLSCHLLLTRAARFKDKAQLLSTAVDASKNDVTITFVVGYDTYARIIDLKYYNNSMDELYETLKLFEECNCEYLVGGRTLGNDVDLYQTIEDVKYSVTEMANLPDKVKQLIRKLFIPLPGFRVDMSSTEIRCCRKE